MLKFIDISNGRVQSSEEVAGFPPAMVAAYDELHAGENHRALLLGDETVVDSAYQIAEQRQVRLRSVGGYVTYLVGNRNITFQRTWFGPDPRTAAMMLARYMEEIAPHHPDGFIPTHAHVEAIRATGGTVMGGVVTLESIDSSSHQFDALWVPKAWETINPLPGMTPEDHAVMLTASYVALSLSQPGYSEN